MAYLQLDIRTGTGGRPLRLMWCLLSGVVNAAKGYSWVHRVNKSLYRLTRPWRCSSICMKIQDWPSGTLQHREDAGPMGRNGGATRTVHAFHSRRGRSCSCAACSPCGAISIPGLVLVEQSTASLQTHNMPALK